MEIGPKPAWRRWVLVFFVAASAPVLGYWLWPGEEASAARPTVSFMPSASGSPGIENTLLRLVDDLQDSPLFEIVPHAQAHDCSVEIGIDRQDQDVLVVAAIRAAGAEESIEVTGEYGEVAGGIRLKLENIRKSGAPSVEAWVYYQKALDQFSKRELGNAIALLRKALEPRSFAYAHELLARIYNISGDREQAREEIRKAVDLAGEMDEGDQLIIRRRKAQIEEDLEAEFRLLKELHRRNPQEPEWNFFLGWFYNAHRRDCSKSRERLSDAVKYARMPSPLYSTYLSHAYLCCGQVDQAVRTLREFLDEHPDAAAFDFLGVIHTLTGEYELARQVLEEAAAIQPDAAHPVLSEGFLDLSIGAYRRAHEKFDEYRAKVESPVEEAEAHWHLARAHLARRRFDDAITEAERALELKPNAAPALWVLGLAQLRKGRPDLARESAQRIEALCDRDVSQHDLEYFHHLNGQIAESAGRLDEAAAELRKAVGLRPTYRALFGDALARALAAGGDFEAAERAYRDVFAFNPNYGRSRCGLAEVHEHQGFVAEAVAQYEHCLRVFGKDNDEEPLAARARERLEVLR